MVAATPSIGRFFATLPDPRRETKNKRHMLLDILVIALCATVAGCTSAVEIAEYGRQKESWFRRVLTLAGGIPSHDTFTRVLAALDPERFNECFVSWVQSLHELTVGEVVAIDGKTLRRSFDRVEGLKSLHVVTAWAADNRLVLGEVAVDEKSNEITAIPRLLALLDVSGAIVTIDAMGCQKEIVEKIREADADYVLAVKDNQPNLHADIIAHFEHYLDDCDALPRGEFFRTQEVNRGRVEERCYYSTPVPAELRGRDEWRDLTSVGMVVSSTVRDGKDTSDVRYYISSVKASARKLCKASREHWGTENSQHWVLDVVFQEDQCRARSGHEPENLAILRRLALNMLRNETTKMPSLKVKGHAAGWNDDLMHRILYGKRS